MKLARLLLILATCSLSSAALAAEPQNNGQGFKVDPSKLDKADPFKARRQLQIIDVSPIVTDCRKPPQGPNNIILNIQPLQPQGGTTTVINVGSPGGGQPGATGAPPGTMVIDANRLGDASRIPSNMNALRNPTGLAPGQTTNRLGNSGVGTVNGTLKPPGQGQVPGQAVARQTGQQAGGPQQIKMVNTGNSSVTSSNNMRTTVSTSATLLHNKQAAAAAAKK